MTTVCEACGRPIPRRRLPGARRYGVLLTPFQCEVLDVIAAAGAAGITTAQAMAELYRNRPPARSPTVKVHCWWINVALAASDYRIVNERRRWFLRKAQVA